MVLIITAVGRKSLELQFCEKKRADMWVEAILMCCIVDIVSAVCLENAYYSTVENFNRRRLYYYAFRFGLARIFKAHEVFWEAVQKVKGQTLKI